MFQENGMSTVVGIDLGTTHSLVAVMREGKPEVLLTREGKRLLPSVLAIGEDDELQIGYAARNWKYRYAKRCLYSVKRLLDCGWGEQDLGLFPFDFVPGETPLRMRLGKESYSAVEVSAFFLRELRLSAEAVLGEKVHQAVISVPAYFNDAQRQATRMAGRLAGWDVLRLLNEPTSAALAYGVDRKKEGLIAVYDLGGGTFDVSILKLREGIFEVLATHGNTHLGGDDLDRVFAFKVLEEMGSLWNEDFSRLLSDTKLYAQVLEASEAAKISFSEQSEVVVSIEHEGRFYEKLWTQEAWEALVLPALEPTRLSCLQALKDANLKPSELSEVLLVGGPTRLACVRRFVEEIFERVPNASLHPDEVVAQGAAIQGSILSGQNQDFLLLDVVPLSLGLETYGGLVASLIPRNTRIPAMVREVFTTFADQQTGVDLHVVQGESSEAKSNRSLARFELKGLRPGPSGSQRIEVSFLMDADGILQVSACDLQTGKAESMEVKPSFGLTQEKIEELLLAGLQSVSSGK